MTGQRGRAMSETCGTRSAGYETARDENGNELVLVGDTWETPEDAASYARAEREALTAPGDPGHAAITGQERGTR
ncbi:MAG TPA: hypothetical protein VK586_09005 [Streptosporangiaceae bacterium]|nr:hypothetical protein [Streptosporangiaceae bacterium]